MLSRTFQCGKFLVLFTTIYRSELCAPIGTLKKKSCRSPSTTPWGTTLVRDGVYRGARRSTLTKHFRQIVRRRKPSRRGGGQVETVQHWTALSLCRWTLVQYLQRKSFSGRRTGIVANGRHVANSSEGFACRISFS